MYGWRGRIGIIFPSTSRTVEPEFQRMAPEGVAVYAARTGDRKLFSTRDGRYGTIAYLVGMAEGAILAAEQLACAEVDVITYADTSGTFVKGPEWEKDLRRRLEERSGIKVVTTSNAAVDALRGLGVKKVAVYTPYSETITNLLRIYLEHQNVRVVETHAMGHHNTLEIAKIHPTHVYRFVKDLRPVDADGVFISCTDLRTIDVIDKLESDLEMPVTTANQVSMWASLKVIGYRDPVSGLGSLLKTL